MRKYISKINTMNESDLNYKTNPRSSKTITVMGFVIIDNGFQGGTHWSCFILKDNESYYFDSFGGDPDKFLLNQFSKPTLYHNY